MKKQLSLKDKRIGRAAQSLVGWWLKETEESHGWHVTENLDVPDSHPDFTLLRGRELRLVEAKGKSELTYTHAMGTSDAGIERNQLSRYIDHSKDGTIRVYILFYIVDEARLYGTTLERAQEIGRGPLNEAVQTDWSRYSTWFVNARKMKVLDEGDHLRAKYEEFYRRIA